MKSFYPFLILFIWFSNNAFFAQELNCQVSVVSTQVQGTDNKRIFDNLQKQIFEFLNNTKWTKDNFNVSERIECSMMLNITEKLNTDQWKATVQLQSRRPIYKSSYNSPIFNYNDQHFVFKYVEQQPFEFNLNTYTNELTQFLAYYAYVFIALDYDSYSPNGGIEYWQKAQQIVANAQTSAEMGWKAFENNKNRYWLVENLLNPAFQPIRDALYTYHRKGLDIMVDKVEEGRSNILEGLKKLQDVHRIRPASYNMQLFFNAKADEIVNIFSQANPTEKQQAVETLTLVDPANSQKYAKINGTN